MKRRVRYEPDSSVFGNPTNVELVAKGIARVCVGELTEREAKISVEIAHVCSGVVLDSEHTIRELEARLLDCQRLLNGGAA